MSKRIVGYVVSHTGKPGGPWEGIGDPYASQAIKARYRAVWHTAFAARACLLEVQRHHPAARILRLVRHERHVVEERAVVEAAMAFVAAPVFDMESLLDLTTACAALRTKRGG